MKRIFSFSMALLLLLTCVACGKAAVDGDTSTNDAVPGNTTASGVANIGGEDITDTQNTDANQPQTGDTKVPLKDNPSSDKTQGGNTPSDKTESNKTQAGLTTKTLKTRAKTTTRAKLTEATTARPTTIPHYTTAKKVTKPSAEDTATYTKQSHTVQQLADAGKWLAHGRAAVVSGQFQMDWVNTGFEIKGKLGGDIEITTVSTRARSLLNVVIDEGDPIVVRVEQGTNKTKIVTGLPKGQHTIKVISGTSLRMGNLAVTKVDYQGELQTIKRDSSRLRIEVLGDSISCGWGLDYSATDEKFSPTEISNSYYSYAAVAARYLNADLQVVALCAQTISAVHGFFPYVNRRARVAWDFENNQQDIVVINLGTNDEAQDIGAAKAVTNMKSLLTDVRKKYPDAYIIWAYGMMRKTYEVQYKEAVQSMNDSKMFTLDLSATKGTGGYEGNHPKRENHERAADYLIDFILKNCK